jgi:hypothetical protein
VIITPLVLLATGASSTALTVKLNVWLRVRDPSVTVTEIFDEPFA